MRTVWKYLIYPETFTISVPDSAILRHVEAKGNEPFMWLEVDTDKAHKTRTFRAFATGESLDKYPAHLEYCGSFLLEKDTLVFHLYEIIEFITEVD